VDKNVVENIITSLEKKFAKESPFVTDQGKVLEYLGMMLYFSVRGKVKLSMYDYVRKILEEVPEDMTGTAKCLWQDICLRLMKAVKSSVRKRHKSSTT